MGKRKSSKPLPKKKAEKVDTVFACPFCNHANSVECKLDREANVGEAACCVCEERFSTKINALSEPIDVYCEWIDECERVNNLADD